MAPPSQRHTPAWSCGLLWPADRGGFASRRVVLCSVCPCLCCVHAAMGCLCLSAPCPSVKAVGLSQGSGLGAHLVVGPTPVCCLRCFFYLCVCNARVCQQVDGCGGCSCMQRQAVPKSEKRLCLKDCSVHRVDGWPARPSACVSRCPGAQHRRWAGDFSCQGAFLPGADEALCLCLCAFLGKLCVLLDRLLCMHQQQRRWAAICGSRACLCFCVCCNTARPTTARV